MLVVAQIALSFALLAGAMIFVRTLHNLLTIDPGFRAAHSSREVRSTHGRLHVGDDGVVAGTAARRRARDSRRAVGGRRDVRHDG